MNETVKRVVRKVGGNRGYVAMAALYARMTNKKDEAEAIKMLSGNKKFFNTHRGERCFVLGNGPSLADVDFNLLADEWVFTVNNFSRVENYTEVHTNCHLWMDWAFFGIRDDMQMDMDLVFESYEQIAREHPVVFVPTAAHEFMKDNGLLDLLSVHYLYTGDPLKKEGTICWDISKAITSYTTVVQYAITVAIYMGFSKIYLLGCDATNIVGLLNNALKIDNGALHAYDNDEVEDLYAQAIGNHKMSELLLDQYKFFLGYEKLYEYCKENGIELVNCSSQTLITSIPRMPLEKVL